MGVDVQIGVKGAEWLPEHPLAKRVEELIGYFRDNESPLYLEQRDGWLEIGSIDRYYGEGYERGSWPQIYGAIRAVVAMYPDHVVTYSGDSSDAQYGEVVTPEMLDRIWQHWLGPSGDEYYDRAKAWNAEAAAARAARSKP